MNQCFHFKVISHVTSIIIYFSAASQTIIGAYYVSDVISIF